MSSLRLLALASLVSLWGCRHRRALRRHPSASPGAPSGAVFRATPADGPATDLGEGRVVRGAMRAVNGRLAAGPVPPDAIVASAVDAAGRWRFVSADGSVFVADRFDGPLRAVTALPFRPRRFDDSEDVTLQGTHSLGALVVLDAAGAAWRVSDAAPARLPLEDVLGALGDGPTLYAVVAPGALLASDDSGASWRTVSLGSGRAWALWRDPDGPLVASSAGTFRLSAAGPVRLPQALTPRASLRVVGAARARLDAAFAGPPFDLRPGATAALSQRTAVSVEGGDLVWRHVPDGAIRRREAAPGTDCRLGPAWNGISARCRHNGWAEVLLFRGENDPGWHILRDEAAAEPLGDTVFDDAASGFATLSACAQQTQATEGALCRYGADGRREDFVVPHRARPRAMHRGRVVALSDDLAHGVFVDTTVQTFALPAGLVGPVAVSLDGAALRVIEAGQAGRVHTLDLSARTWTSRPSGAPRPTLLGDRGAAELDPLGAAVTAASGAAWRIGEGHPTRLADAETFSGLRCFGALCAASPSRWLNADGSTGRTLVAADVPAVAQVAVSRFFGTRPWACTAGRVGRAPEIDRGVAVSGHALTMRAVNATTTALRWYGQTLRGEVTVAHPGRPGGLRYVRGVQGATRPAALLASCGDNGCDHFLVTPDGPVDLALGRRDPLGVEASAWPEGYLVRADQRMGDLLVVSLRWVAAGRRVEAASTVVLRAEPGETAAGQWHGAWGLFAGGPGGALRFYPMGPGAPETVLRPEVFGQPLGACGRDEGDAEGALRWHEGVPVVRGEGWFLEGGRWQAEVRVALRAGRACVTGFSAGEAHDEAESEGREEREPVRTFVLAADGDALAGTAWSGERSVALRCTASTER
ncbi:MAG: hypothetical protein JNK72_11840 [Myxococcales bacterium]|nr:hypothetical protein [Myxococcales bacterium]